MSEIESKICPCSSGNIYKECCEPLHKGKRSENALKLMRSRFSAYALNLPDYIIKTTHPASPQYSDNLTQWRTSISNFSRHGHFVQLEILDFKEHQSMATVTFTAHITQGDSDSSFTEKSYFEKRNGEWLYKGGQIAEGHAPNLVTTGQLRLLPLAYLGDAILRQRAEPIMEISEDIKKLVEEMVETMDVYNGIGLAAPQVHHSIRLFIVRTPIPTGNDQYDKGDLEVFINPKLSSPSKKTVKGFEGCLSIPGIRGEVERPCEIVVDYTRLDGERVQKTCYGWEARVIMHENDHINGVLYIDRMDKKERAALEPGLQSMKKRIHDGLDM